MPVDVLIRHLNDFGEEADETDRSWRAIAQEYVDGAGLFPERIHANALYWVLLDRWARLRADWAEWAASEVADWPDSAGPGNRATVQAMLARALGDSPDFLSERHSSR